jgi:D-3-phosphoglycerate dehydrogenase
MFKIQTLNNSSTLGLERLPRERYPVASGISRGDLACTPVEVDSAIPAGVVGGIKASQGVLPTRALAAAGAT